MRNLSVFLVAMLLGLPIQADEESWDAALGGALGGGLGAYLGHEVGGRDGAILGGALGGATGAAISTQGSAGGARGSDPVIRYDDRRPPGHSTYFCPPGQAKKGRC